VRNESRSGIVLTFLTTSLLVGSELCAQADWTKLSPAAKPSARGNALFAASSDSLYVFAGNSNGTTFFNDLWAYRGANWVQLTADNAAGSPAKRRWGSACWDFGRNELVVFGGQDAAKNNLGDTWVYGSGKWTQKSPTSSPSARRWAAMAYDWANGRVLLFGGYGSKNMNDTWAWTGSDWVKLTPSTTPPIKSRMGMVAIKETKEIVMYGGTTTSSTATPTTEMWKWDGKDWAQVKQSGGPTSGVAPGMVYDELRSRIVFYGGHNVSPKPDTYEWDGTAWKKMKVTSPGPRSGPAMGYVSALHRTVMFGGYSGKLPMLDDSWQYATSKPADYTVTGTACKSSAGLPKLSATSLPWTGDTLHLEVSPVPATAPVLVALGISKTQWGSFKLPLDLSVVATGCTLYASLDFLLVAPNANGTAKLALPIPATTDFAGVKFYNQALIIELPANQLGTLFSALGEATIGVR